MEFWELSSEEEREWLIQCIMHKKDKVMTKKQALREMEDGGYVSHESWTSPYEHVHMKANSVNGVIYNENNEVVFDFWGDKNGKEYDTGWIAETSPKI